MQSCCLCFDKDFVTATALNVPEYLKQFLALPNSLRNGRKEDLYPRKTYIQEDLYPKLSGKNSKKTTRGWRKGHGGSVQCRETYLP